MKKSFCLLIALIMLFLCGCNNNYGITALTKEISFVAKIKLDDEFYEFKVNIDKNSNFIFKTVSPEKIAGSVFEISNSNAVFSLGELKHETALENLPHNSPVSFIYYVFSDISQKPDDVKFQNNEYFITGKFKNYDYKLILGNSGLPIKIIDNKNNLTAIIKEASID